MVVASKSWSNEGNWGMGLLFVFFHHQSHDEDHHHPLKKRPSFSLSSLTTTITNAALLSKTQSTLFICALLFFTTLLLFSLFPFEPAASLPSSHRRVLRQLPRTSHLRGSESNFSYPPALQGMGALYRRGTKAMTDLVVGHVTDRASEREIVTFLRLIQHSGLLSRSDLALIFASPQSASRLGRVVKSESDSFVRLVQVYRQLNSSVATRGFNRYLRPVGEDEKEALWGKKKGSWDPTELTRATYGSIVGFDASELDPENSLSGFIGHVPMSLRRWACYPMILGRVRRNYKHTMLINVGDSLVISDPFTRIRNRTTESVLVFPNSDESSQFNPAVILGGGRGVRRFTNAALTEIVRVVVEHKGKGRNLVTESGVVNQLVLNGHLLKNINLIISDESIPKASELVRFNSSGSPGRVGLLGYPGHLGVVLRGHSGSLEVDSMVRREICSNLYSTVYRDCLASQ